MARRIALLAVFVAVGLLPLENALRLDRLDGQLGAVAEARRRRRTPRARRRLGARLFGLAQRQMLEGRYQEAIQTFNRSFGLLPTPQTLLALAQCYELSGQLGRARRLYQRMLRKPGNLSKAMLKKRLAAVKRRIEGERAPPEVPPSSQPTSQPTSRPTEEPIEENIGDEKGDVAQNIFGDEGDQTADVGGTPDEDAVSDTSPLEVSGLLSGWIRAALDVDMAHDRADGPTDIPEDSLELRHRMLLRMKVNYGAKYHGSITALVDHVVRERPPEGDDTFLLFNGQSASSELNTSIVEAYVGLSFWRMDIRGGMLRLAWGKSDYNSPNDVINPRDATNLLREELEILRLPVLALETTIDLRPMTVELVWQPLFRPDRLAYYGTDSAMIGPGAAAPVRGLVRFIQSQHDDTLTPMVQRVLMQTELPPSDPRSSSLGMRLGLQVHGVDFTLYYHYGWDVSPHVEIDPQVMGVLATVDWSTANLQTLAPLAQLIDSGVPLYSATFIRRHHVGADVVATLGSFSLRAELGLDERRLFYDSLFQAHIEPAVAAGVGFDYSKSLYQSVSLDASYLFVGGGPEEFLFYNRHYAAVGGMARWGILRGNLVGELRGMIGIAPFSYVLRPQVTYKITQSWWVTAGVVVLGGDSRSVGGLFDRNDLIFFEGTYNL
jgi:hypothetical protein